MSLQDQPTRGPARPLPYVIAGVLVVVAIVLPLAVPMYARATPALWGIPFFYWYQLLWVFIAAGLLAIAYVLVNGEDKRRRAEVRDVRPAPDAPTRDRRFRS